MGTHKCAMELSVMMRTSEFGSSAVDNSLGSSNLVRRAWPIWFVPNWISKPSLVVPAGVIMMPALFISMSRRLTEELTTFAASMIESNEARSNCKKVILALGTTSLILWTAAWPFSVLRAARNIWLGLCFAS